MKSSLFKAMLGILAALASFTPAWADPSPSCQEFSGTLVLKSDESPQCAILAQDDTRLQFPDVVFIPTSAQNPTVFHGQHHWNSEWQGRHGCFLFSANHPSRSRDRC